MWIKQKIELVRKVGLFGLNDVRKLAPIGDLGYANGWYHHGFLESGTFMKGGLERMIYEAACYQEFSFKCVSHRETGVDTVYRCEELGFIYHVDSSDLIMTAYRNIIRYYYPQGALIRYGSIVLRVLPQKNNKPSCVGCYFEKWTQEKRGTSLSCFKHAFSCTAAMRKDRQHVIFRRVTTNTLNYGTRKTYKETQFIEIMDYTQCYCYECKYCTNNVFGRVICLAKDTVTGDYNKACPDFDDRYNNNEL